MPHDTEQRSFGRGKVIKMDKEMSLEQCIAYITNGREYFISWETILKLLCELQKCREEKQISREMREDDRWEG